MATLEFGSAVKSADDYVKEIYELLGINCPIKVQTVNGKLKNVSVETQWSEGGTVPIEEEVEVEKTVLVDDVEETEVENDEGGTTKIVTPVVREEKIKVTETRVVDYEENYDEKSLTSKQIADLNKYIEDNIEQ